MNRVVFARPKEQLSTTVTWFFQGAYGALYIPLSSRPTVVQLLKVENSQDIRIQCALSETPENQVWFTIHMQNCKKNVNLVKGL